MTAIARAILLSAALVAVGCSHIATTSLVYDPIAVTGGAATHSLTVVPLTDSRKPRTYPSLQGNLFKTYIPLLPYVEIDYERLDESFIAHQSKRTEGNLSREHFTVAMAREVARDLESSELFVSVVFDPDGEIASDLQLGGTLESSELSMYYTSYMLGAPGVLLWLLPIPLGKVVAEVRAGLELRDQRGKVLWSHQLDETASQLFTLYNSGGGSTSSRFRIEIKRYGNNKYGIDPNSLWAYHAEALRDEMEEAKRSLAKFLRSYGTSGPPNNPEVAPVE